MAVTGGNDPMAPYVIEEMIRAGHEIRVLVRQEPTSFDGDIQIIHGDILDVSALEALMDGADVVIHLEEVSSLGVIPKDKLYKINVEGTGNVVNVALTSNVNRLVFRNTVYALGDSPSEAGFDEHAKWSSVSEAKGYVWSKHLAEREVARGHVEGVEAVILYTGIVPTALTDKTYSAEVLAVIRSREALPEGSFLVTEPQDIAVYLRQMAEADSIEQRYISMGKTLNANELKEQTTGSKHLTEKALRRIFWFSRLFRQKLPNGILPSRQLAAVLSDKRKFINDRFRQQFSAESIEQA